MTVTQQIITHELRVQGYKQLSGISKDSVYFSFFLLIYLRLDKLVI